MRTQVQPWANPWARDSVGQGGGRGMLVIQWCGDGGNGEARARGAVEVGPGVEGGGWRGERQWVRGEVTGGGAKERRGGVVEGRWEVEGGRGG